jgi:hypothetical protein
MIALLIAAPLCALGQASAKQQQIANEVVPEMIQAGLLRVDRDARRTWIDPAYWICADAQDKENVTLAIAVYCHAANPTLELFDKQSRKQIASYGPFRGFRVY